MASPYPEEATVAHKPSYWKMSKGDFFPGESFKSWNAYKSALSQTCFLFKDRLMSHSDDANQLGERCLSWWDLTWFGFVAVIGAGIFVLTGQEAHNHAGPGIALSYVLSGLSAMLSVFCYTEFAVEIPVAGGSFAYLRVELGDFAKALLGARRLQGAGHLLVLVVYCLMALSLSMTQPYTEIDPNAFYSLAFQSEGMKWAKSLAALGVLKGMTTVPLVGALGQARYTTRMARAHMIPPWFAHLIYVIKLVIHQYIVYLHDDGRGTYREKILFVMLIYYLTFGLHATYDMAHQQQKLELPKTPERMGRSISKTVHRPLLELQINMRKKARKKGDSSSNTEGQYSILLKCHSSNI
ncbi:hypothetical protein Cgig2_030722 [Carnegiea gigantea]|uniref:Uncharacterized protein n=1 Tax=Carnegiea gigantea TaxID=171969 RepID=A0A9Q1QEI1_9CARY|nr:hypothetical protein Cgig2_030722 [Carnegiea gigantea]